MFIPDWIEPILQGIAWFWLETIAITIGYTAMLWTLGNIEFVGWTFWKKFIPIARFKIIKKEGWYFNAWAKYFPHAFICVIIHKKDIQYPIHAELEIVHEFEFIRWQLALGMVFYLLYAMEYVILSGKGKDTFHENWFEKRASRIEKEWVEGGMPSIFVPLLRNGANA